MASLPSGCFDNISSSKFWLRGCFTHSDPEGDIWKTKDELRIMASFRKFNLFDDFSGLGKFDIIFCRNVAIYFSIEDRKIIFGKIADILEPGGRLIIGSSEYLASICDRFQSQRHLKSVFYQLKEESQTQPRQLSQIARNS